MDLGLRTRLGSVDSSVEPAYPGEVIWPPHLGIPWYVIGIVIRFVAFIVAIVLARRQRTYAPVAWLLGFAVVADFIAPAITILILTPAETRFGLPFTGFPRAAYHVTQALFVGYTAGVTALAVKTFARRSAWPVGLAYLVVVAVLVLGYPTIRRELLQSVYLGVTLAALLVSFASIVVWWRTKPVAPPIPAEIAAGLIVLFEGEVAPAELVLYDPEGQSFAVRELDDLDLEWQPVAAADGESVVPVSQELPSLHEGDGEGIAAAIGEEASFELCALLDREARDERRDLRVDGELVGGLVSAVFEGFGHTWPDPSKEYRKPLSPRSGPAQGQAIFLGQQKGPQRQSFDAEQGPQLLGGALGTHCP